VRGNGARFRGGDAAVPLVFLLRPRRPQKEDQRPKEEGDFVVGDEIASRARIDRQCAIARLLGVI
jgi:hypothetical protein